MTDYILPFGFALLTWWLSTGVILFLNHLPRDTYRWSMLVASCLLAACLYGLHTGSSNTTEMGALIAFSQALLVWAWLEMSYSMPSMPCVSVREAGKFTSKVTTAGKRSTST